MTPQQVLAAHVTEAPRPVSEHRTTCPPALAETVMRCLAKRPADRWQSADELVERLESLGTPSGGMTPTQTQPTRAVRIEDAWYRHPGRMAGTFLVAAIALLGAVYFLTIQLGMPDWVPWAAAALVGAGLPIMIVTGLVERRREKARATGMYSASGETGMQRHLTWKRSLRSGYLAFGALAVSAIVYTAMRLLGIGPVGTLMASGKLSEKDQLIVADFDNRTRDSTLAASVTEAFRIDLSQSPTIRILSTSAVTDALGRMQQPANAPLTPALARDLAQREGAKAVVAGEISAVGRSYVLVAKIISAQDGSELIAIRETAPDDAGIVAAIDRLSGKVRERIGESLRTIRGGQPLEKVTTSSLEALRLYSEANHLSDQGEASKAIPILQQAIALDSSFAMAWRKLAVALGNVGASLEEQAAATTRAYQHRDRLPELERELTTAYYYDRVDSRPELEEAAYRRILAVDPLNDIALNNLALTLGLSGRFAESESLAVVAVNSPGSLGNTVMQLLNAQLAQGKFDAARQTIANYGKTAPGSPIYLRGRTMVLQATGPVDSARRALLEMGLQVHSSDYQSFMRIGLTLLALQHGRLTEAEREREASIALQVQRGLPGQALFFEVNRARQLLFFSGDSAAALRVLQDALARYPLKSIPPLDRPYGTLATVYAMAGRTAEARHLLTEAESAVPEGARRGDATWYQGRGWLALGEGRPKDALAEFRDIARKGQRAEWGHWEAGLAFDRANLPDSALVEYQISGDSVGSGFKSQVAPWVQAPSLKRLGEIYEAKGDRAKAIENYTRFVELWKDADPVLQPAVREVKERLAKLAGEAK